MLTKAQHASQQIGAPTASRQPKMAKGGGLGSCGLVSVNLARGVPFGQLGADSQQWIPSRVETFKSGWPGPRGPDLDRCFVQRRRAAKRAGSPLRRRSRHPWPRHIRFKTKPKCRCNDTMSGYSPNAKEKKTIVAGPHEVASRARRGAIPLQKSQQRPASDVGPSFWASVWVKWLEGHEDESSDYGALCRD